MSGTKKVSSSGNSLHVNPEEPTCPILASEKYFQDSKNPVNYRKECLLSALKVNREQITNQVLRQESQQRLDTVTPAKHLQIPRLGFSSIKYRGSSTKTHSSVDLKPRRIRKSSLDFASDSGTFNDNSSKSIKDNSTLSSESKEDNRASHEVNDNSRRNISFDHDRNGDYSCSSFGDLMKTRHTVRNEEINDHVAHEGNCNKNENDNLSQRLRMDVESTTSLAPKAAFERENIPAKSCRELWKLRDPSPQLTSKKEPVHHRVNPVQTVSQPQNTVKKPITNEENPQQSELHKLAKASTNMICVSGHFYQVMGVLGDGGSSRVYDGYNAENKLRAIKIVNLKSADKSVQTSYINEIAVLRRLQHSHRVVKLYDYEFNDEQKLLYVVMERGEIDLATFLKANSKQGSITREMVKFYWSEMLRAVQVIHNAGIIHSDLKPANFLLVAGQLKLIDFGIASTISHDETSIIKESRAGTPSYMSPEAFMNICEDENQENVKIKIGVKSDVWSLGCILYHMVYGHTPFHEVRDPLKKMLMIVNPQCIINFAPLDDHHLLDVLKRCIVRDVKKRASIGELLNHPYLKKTSPQNPQLESVIHSLSGLSPESISKVSRVLNQLKKTK